MNLANGLSTVFIFAKNRLLVLLIFAIVSFISFSFLSDLIFMISFLLLILFFFFVLSLISLDISVELGNWRAWGREKHQNQLIPYLEFQKNKAAIGKKKKKNKRKKTQINRIRNEKEVTTDTAEIQRIMRDYYKQPYANKMGNLEEMDKFLEMHNLLRLNQEEIENINRGEKKIHTWSLMHL